LPLPCPGALQREPHVHPEIGVIFSGPVNFMAIIEILYIKNQETGYIFASQLSLARLIEKGLIDQAQLIRISF
jgi:hypothetical protein